MAFAVGVGYLFYRGSRLVNLRRFFRVTGAMIILFAAGLLSKGVHEFQEAGFLPSASEHVWDLSGITFLDPDRSFFAELLKGVFGWSPAPSIEMVAVWLTFLIPLGTLFLLRTRQIPVTRHVVASEAGASA